MLASIDGVPHAPGDGDGDACGDGDAHGLGMQIGYASLVPMPDDVGLK